MFATQFDVYFYVVKQSCKARLKNDKNLQNLSKSLWRRTKGMTLIMYLVCKSKPENSSKVLHTLNTWSLFSKGSKTDFVGSSLERSLQLLQRSDWHQLTWKIIRYTYSEFFKKSGLRLLQLSLICFAKLVDHII